MSENFIEIEPYSGVKIRLRKIADGSIQLSDVSNQSTASDWQTLTNAEIFNRLGRCNEVSTTLIRKLDVKPVQMFEESQAEYSGAERGTAHFLEAATTYLAALRAMINIKENKWAGVTHFVVGMTREQNRENWKADDQAIKQMKAQADEITEELEHARSQYKKDDHNLDQV